jgi:FAD dependent monooxygenase
MSTRFACVYGITPPMNGILEGDCFSVYREKASALSFTGKDGVVFWFVFEDLNETLPLSKSPRYKPADANAICQSVAHLRIAPTVLFGDIIAKQTMCTKTALEEGVAPVWHSSRTVIVGDAAHKVSPSTIVCHSTGLMLHERWSQMLLRAAIRQWSPLPFC